METFLLPLNICYYIFSFIHACYGHQAVTPVGILLVYDAIALNHFFTAKIVLKKGENTTVILINVVCNLKRQHCSKIYERL